MRKQTKLAAVFFAAALLAIGASMTSFAAGWQKDEDGTWHYYDNDDEMVTGQWKRNGNKYFYLDDDGNMVTDMWIDDDYYVGPDGAMLVNQWIKTTSSDEVDDPDDGGGHWYFFGNKGKKVVDGSKKIDSKTYYFNEDGEMQTGWYQDPDANNADKVYYLGDEDEGARVENSWLWLERPTDEEDDEDDGWYDDEDCSLDCDDEGWYWFGLDGVMYHDNTSKKQINKKYYYFNAHGQMLYEWINTKSGEDKNSNAIDGIDENVASASIASQGQANKTLDNMRYANQVEEGWGADGWYEIEGAEDAGTSGDTSWYYIDNGEVKKAEINDIVGTATDDGKPVYRARIKCEGKYFSFDEKGQMQSGLQYIDGAIYYFDENGYMKTGKVAAVEEEDNDEYPYYFRAKSGGNGKGENGEKDGYLYWNGKRMEADDDYKLVVVDAQLYLVNSKGKIQKSAKKNYALEGLDKEDVQIEINKSTHEVWTITTEKGNGTLVYAKGSKRPEGFNGITPTYSNEKDLVENGLADLPTIAIYDNVLTPAEPYKKGFSGRFYNVERVDDEVAVTDSAAISQITTTDGEEDSE